LSRRFDFDPSIRAAEQRSSGEVLAFDDVVRRDTAPLRGGLCPGDSTLIRVAEKSRHSTMSSAGTPPGLCPGDSTLSKSSATRCGAVRMT
jgi:hypothetical protein